MSSFICEHPLEQQCSVWWDWITCFKFITQNKRQTYVKLKIKTYIRSYLKSQNNNQFLSIRKTSKIEAVFHLNMRN